MCGRPFGCWQSLLWGHGPPGLRLSKANTSDTEAPFLDLHLSISNGFVSSKLYDKRDDFDFDTVNFPFLDGDVPRSAACGVCVSRLVRFAGVSGRVAGFGACGGSLTARFLQRGCWCRRLRKTFSGFCRRRCGLVSGFNVGLKTLLHQGLSVPGFCGGLVYGFRKVVGGAGFSGRFGGIIVRYKRVWYSVGVVRQSAYLVFGPVTVGGFGCTPVGRASGSVVAPAWGCLFGWLGTGLFCMLLGPPGFRFNCWFSFARVFQWCCSTPQGSPGVGHGTLFLSSSHLCFVVVFVCDLFVSRDGPLVGWGGGLRAGRASVCFGPWRGPGARWGPVWPVKAPQHFNADRSKAVLLLWFLTVTCSCCPNLFFGSAIMLVTYFSKFLVAE